MQQHAVDPVGQGNAVPHLQVEAADDTRRPIEARIGMILDPCTHIRRAGERMQPLGHRCAPKPVGDRPDQPVGPRAGAAVDRDHRQPVQQCGQPFGIDAATLGFGQVIHRQRDDGGRPQLDHHGQKVQGAGDVRRIEHGDDQIGTGQPLGTHHRVRGHLLIGAQRQQRIGAGRVGAVPDLGGTVAIRTPIMQPSGLQQHGGARGVHHLRAGAQQRVEQRGFADIRIADEHDMPQRIRFVLAVRGLRACTAIAPDNAHAVRIPSVEAHGLVAAAGEQCAEPAPVGMIAVFGRVRRKAVHGCGHRVISSVSSDILTRMARAVPPSSAMRSGPRATTRPPKPLRCTTRMMTPARNPSSINRKRCRSSRSMPSTMTVSPARQPASVRGPRVGVAVLGPAGGVVSITVMPPNI